MEKSEVIDCRHKQNILTVFLYNKKHGEMAIIQQCLLKIDLLSKLRLQSK